MKDMSWLHFHLLISSFSVAGIWIAWVVLTVGVIKRHGTVEKVGLKMLAGLALINLSVYLSGQKAAQQLPELSSAAELLNAHEMLAAIGLNGLLVLGILGAWGVVLINRSRRPDGRPVPRWFFPLVILLTMVLGLELSMTASLGSMMSHPEIRQDPYSRWIENLLTP
jgi:hypothetical protein